ncbi:MAG: DUF4097 domain-containing protein [Acidobacteriia bacterium]|nr:DUF4097 domain-containing protein [Terriglobia bacterium]
MKKMLALTATMFAACGLACAQEAAGDRVVVPARNSARPRQVNATLLTGSITVKTSAGKDVIVETSGGPRTEPAPPPPAGMRRIDSPHGLEVSEEDNVITVKLSPMVHANLVITVPPDTSLKLRSAEGPLTVDGVRGEIEAKNLDGAVTLTHVSGTVVADTLNGELNVSMDRVDPGKPMSFSTLNGAINVSLPAETKANLKMKTDNGSINSDFDIKLTGGGATTEPNTTKDGKYRVRFDKTMYGTINGGGPEFSFRTLNGTINIRKK